jgi:RimJ/RimL family protein N-acetyltransferase
MNLQPVTLKDQHVRLEPLALSHLAGLQDAVQDGELWKLWYTSIPTVEGMQAEIQRRLALQTSGHMLPFTVFDLHQQRIVGMTTYMNVDTPNRRVEIGSTWYRQSVQRTSLNTECKRLLLTHAFEAQKCIAVEFRTHVFNQQSRRAIERLGAKLDGILRQHQINAHPLAQQALRDTCVYSIIDSEWPNVKLHLDHQLSRTRLSSHGQPTC